MVSKSKGKAVWKVGNTKFRGTLQRLFTRSFSPKLIKYIHLYLSIYLYLGQKESSAESDSYGTEEEDVTFIEQVQQEIGYPPEYRSE